MSNRLVDLYVQMYELTNKECGACRVPYGCCSVEYCDMAVQWAKDEWNIELKPVDGWKTLPFIGDKGCVVAPHLRPLCTIHSCSMNAYGFLSTEENTDIYFKIRNEINELESRRTT